MKIHEYQGKELFRKAGVQVPEGYVAFSVEEALGAADKLGSYPVVVKAQIHAGGRGKGGGIKLATSRDEVKQHAKNILGMNLVTHQTGPEGKTVQRILVEAASNIDREMYAGIVLDRVRSQYCFMVSTEGGVEIEKVAAETPEKILKIRVDPGQDLKPYQARQLAFGLNLEGTQVKNGIKVFMGLWKAFKQNDCSLIEINPLVVTKENEVIALDSKVNFDGNALYRHKDLLEYRDITEEEPSEIEAGKHNLNYIKLDGTVGCMVNGAGLAMATMDIIKLYGGDPANFLDVGGVANAETVAQGFEIILSDPNVTAVLINIFGGIVRCDRVAQGVIDAMEKVSVAVAVVVRLEGTNAEEAATLLVNSTLKFIVATSLEDAAEKVVKVSKGEIA